MDGLHETLYYALQGLETQLSMEHECCISWPCKQIVHVGVEVAQMMLGDDEVEEHKLIYYNLIRRRLYGDQRETMLTIVVMAALFNLIQEDYQAKRCRATLSEDWGDEINDIYHAYRHAVDRQIDCELDALGTTHYTISVMSKAQNQITVYNYGTYNDIHDNPNATIYAAPQETAQDNIIPPEGDYSALVRWLEFEKLRGNDLYAEADYNRSKLCRNLLKIIGWEPNQDSLRKAQNR